MAGNSKYKLKILSLIDVLTEKTDSEHMLTTSEMCEELEKRGIKAERKSIYNDIETLREYGFEIVHMRVPKNGFYLGKRRLEISEAHLLTDAVQAADFLPEDKKSTLIKKVLSSLSEYESEKILSKISVKDSKSGAADAMCVLNAIHSAIDSGKQLNIKYARRCIVEKSLSAQVKEFTVTPYALTWAGEHYYLIANNGKYDNLMHLRVDRIQRAKVAEEEARHFSEVSEYREFFDVADYTEKVFNMFSGEIAEIQLVCDNSIIEDISDRFGSDGEYRPYDIGTFVVKAQAGISEGLVSWLFQFGAKIKIKAPQMLKDMYAKRLEEINRAMHRQL